LEEDVTYDEDFLSLFGMALAGVEHYGILGSGMSFQEILADYEDLEQEDIVAVLDLATRLSRVKRIDLAVV
jgi:hypothetical protein